MKLNLAGKLALKVFEVAARKLPGLEEVKTTIREDEILKQLGAIPLSV